MATDSILSSLELRESIEVELLAAVDKLRSVHRRGTADDWRGLTRDLNESKKRHVAAEVGLAAKDEAALQLRDRISALESANAAQLVDVLRLREERAKQVVAELNKDTDDADALREALRQREARVELLEVQVKVTEERCRESNVERDSFQDKWCFAKQDLELLRQKLEATESALEKRVRESESKERLLTAEVKEAVEYKSHLMGRLGTMEDEQAELNGQLLKVQGEFHRSQGNLSTAQESGKATSSETDRLLGCVQEKDQLLRLQEETLRGERAERERVERERERDSKKYLLENASFKDKVEQQTTALHSQQQLLDNMERERGELYNRLRDKAEAFETLRVQTREEQAEALVRERSLEDNIRVRRKNPPP